MSSKNKSADGANKGKTESLWKKAFTANSEWPDKVSFKITRLFCYLQLNGRQISY